MKYASLLEADCRVLDTVKANMVTFWSQLQFHATSNDITGFILLGRSSNIAPGLMPTRLGSRDMVDGTWYMDIASSAGMTPSC